MNKGKRVNDQINHEIKVIRNCKTGNVMAKAFIRNRKLTFDDAINLMLTRKGRTMGVELFEYYHKIGKDAVSKQDYAKQRKQIKMSFFEEALAKTNMEFYRINDYETYQGYIVIAIDGSKVILPRCSELEEEYGIANANNSQQTCVQCNVSGCYDCLNKRMLDIKIAPYASEERELAKKNIETIEKMLPDKKFLLLFDRGYPSVEMLHFLQKHQIKYLFRIQESTYSQEKRAMKSKDEEIEIKLRGDRLNGKMSMETKEELKQLGSIKTRFVQYTLSSGTTEWLATNLEKEEADTDEVGEMYFLRWKIEESYNTLKNKLQLENISGKSSLIVKQDIYTTILIHNMIALIEFLMKEEKLNKPGNKYHYQINENVLIGAFKDLLLEIIITDEESKQQQLYELLLEYVTRYKVANRPNRSNPRKFKNGNLKGKTNLKRSF